MLTQTAGMAADKPSSVPSLSSWHQTSDWSRNTTTNHRTHQHFTSHLNHDGQHGFNQRS